MINEKVKSVYSLMAANEEVAAKLAAVKSPEEAVAILAENNVTVSVEELKELVNSVSKDELPAEMLDMVAGGGKAFDFFWGFCDGLRTAFERVQGVFGIR